MNKETKSRIQLRVQELEKEYNPYKTKAIKYYIDMKPMYRWGNNVYTEQGITDAYIETAIKDMTRGYEERMVGWYDKWYRYNHADEGMAYDIGQSMAVENPKCSKEFNIIECMN